MSADTYLTVVCDACREIEGHWPVRVANHTELRRLLRETRGWHRPKPGRDICPNCWKEGRR